MARPNWRVLADMNDVLSDLEGKYHKTVQDVIQIEDSGERVATAKTLADMLRSAITDLSKSLRGLVKQKWQREAEERKEPEEVEPIPASQQESIFRRPGLPKDAFEDFDRLAGLRRG